MIHTLEQLTGLDFKAHDCDAVIGRGERFAYYIWDNGDNNYTIDALNKFNTQVHCKTALGINHIAQIINELEN